MRIPRTRFTIRSMMILVALIAIILGSIMLIHRLDGEQNDDGFINDPMHLMAPLTPVGPDLHRPR